MPSSLTGMIDVVVNTTAQEQREAAAKNFASVANTVGPLALVQDGAVDRLLTLCQASGKAGASEREAAATICAELAAINNAALNAILISKLGSAIKQLLGDKSRRAANTAKQTLGTMFNNISLDHGYSALYLLIDTQNQPWPALQWQMEMLAPWAEGSMAPVINHALREIMPVIADLMWHDKDAVKSAASKALELVMRTVTNKDVEPFLPSVAETILHPDSVDACLERLASTTFVAEVKGDALAVMEPLLTRGLQLQRHTATKRQAARIIESMVKLVDDPREVEPFVPKLLPALEKAKDTVPDPECREVCTKAYDQLVLCLSKEHGKALDREYVMSLVANDKMDKDLSRFVAGVIQSLAADIHNEPKWVAALEPLMALLGVTDKEHLAPLVHDLRTKVSHYVAVEAEEEEDDDKELLCDCEFSLAFGSKILLNLTRLKLIRGARYGLCGKNDCGKTSLMRAISRNQLEGFPDPSTVRTVFVETEIQGELSDLSVLDYIFADPLLRNCGVTREEMSATLISVGFGLDGPASIDKQVGRLSGGWKMKLALARAMLLKADILLLDEPTNHLDTKNRQWVEEYLQSLTNVTSIMVSHDSGFLDRVCSHILHIDNLKIKAYRGNLTAFVEQVPEAKAYFELQASKYKFKFPMPGPLEGIKSKGRHILKMSNVTFTYPGAAKAQLNNVSVRVSLSSRVACVGPNGAGKSTMIKLLTGELLPDEGFPGTEVWKHPNCRVAYVAQHAFHHIESHLEKTPNEYIRWRYQYGVDKEALKKQNMQETDEEKLKQKEPVMVEIADAEGNKKREKRVIKELTNGRRQEHKGRRNEYEVLLVGGNDQRVWMLETQLAQMGFEKAMKEVDERISSMAAGFNRPLSSAFVETHLMDVGLEREFATHTNIRALSGGQKVKVVLAAALWKCPHIIIIDEPTNYLDRESLGALAEAIKEFEGGVVIVSHNNEFCEACCPETWVLENHTLNIKGDPEWLAAAEKELVKTVEEDDEDLKDAFGNTIQRKKKATRQDMKKLKKKIEQLRKAGEEVWTDEELEKMGLEAPTD